MTEQTTTAVVSQTRKQKPRRSMRRIAGALVTLLILLSICWWIGVFGGNVRTVAPGLVYRSAQLSGANYTAETARWEDNGLANVLRRDHIHTVINLRGGGMQNDYYRDELAQCRTAGAVHVDIPMSAVHLPPPSSLKELLHVFDHDPYPVLFHCQGGSDRSGLVGALYLAIYQHVPLDKAETEQLTMRYGHFAFTSTGRMNAFFNLYRKYGGGMNMRKWIIQKYPSIYRKVSKSAKANG